MDILPTCPLRISNKPVDFIGQLAVFLSVIMAEKEPNRLAVDLNEEVIHNGL